MDSAKCMPHIDHIHLYEDEKKEDCTWGFLITYDRTSPVDVLESGEGYPSAWEAIRVAKETKDSWCWFTNPLIRLKLRPFMGRFY